MNRCVDCGAPEDAVFGLDSAGRCPHCAPFYPDTEGGE